MSKKEDKEEESELEELIDEEKLKEIIQDIKEESEDKEIPKSNIKEGEFREFLDPESSSPVLEKIAGEQELGGRVFSTSGMDRTSKDDDKAFRYDAQAPEDKPKYQGDYSSTNQNLERVDIAKAGRDIAPQIREAGFVSSLEQTNSSMQETYQEVQGMDATKISQLGRENPFETQVKGVEQKKSEYIVK